jgi:DNA segregation ATPase FtsK/SpoIIIE-like protein
MAEFTFTEEIDDIPPGPRPRARQGSIFWEVVAVVIGLFALFLMISLFVGPEGGSLIGPVGQGTSRLLVFLFGNIMAFTIPAFLMWFAVQLFLGYRTRWSPGRSLGICMLVLAATGMLALPNADDPTVRTETFSRAGAVGTFMVEWEGLRLVGTFGVIGAAMILGAMALVGFVMITRVSLSGLVLRAVTKIRERREAAPRVIDVAQPAGKATSLFARSRPASNTPIVEDEDGDEDAPAAAPEPERASSASRDAGLLGGLFGRKEKEALLSEPDPEEQEDYELQPSYDEDALAASRALEEARIDEEYERALREEEKRLKGGVTELDEEEAEEDDIVFHDATGSLPVLKGNPANDEEDEVDDAVLGDGLAKLFPNRWEKEGEDVVRRAPKKKAGPDDEVIRGRAEGRAFRHAAQDPEPEFDEEDLPEDGEGDGDDPLFNEELDTRPAGPLAAQKAASVSAVERDEELAAERKRVLGAYRLPDVQQLDDPPKIDTRMSREEMLEISQTLERTFADFGIAVKVVEVKQGPVVTRFELKPAPGVKVSRIVGLEHDVALAMKAASVRIVAPIPGKAAVGIEIPNKNRAGVYLKELVSCSEFWEHSSPLAFALGKTIEGTPYFADLKKMPHLLIAGATGAGKSVCLNTVICSLLYSTAPRPRPPDDGGPQARRAVDLPRYPAPHLAGGLRRQARRGRAALGRRADGGALQEARRVQRPQHRRLQRDRPEPREAGPPSTAARTSSRCRTWSSSWTNSPT